MVIDSMKSKTRIDDDDGTHAVVSTFQPSGGYAATILLEDGDNVVCLGLTSEDEIDEFVRALGREPEPPRLRRELSAARSERDTARRERDAACKAFDAARGELVSAVGPIRHERDAAIKRGHDAAEEIARLHKLLDRQITARDAMQSTLIRTLAERDKALHERNNWHEIADMRAREWDKARAARDEALEAGRDFSRVTGERDRLREDLNRMITARDEACKHRDSAIKHARDRADEIARLRERNDLRRAAHNEACRQRDEARAALVRARATTVHDEVTVYTCRECDRARRQRDAAYRARDEARMDKALAEEFFDPAERAAEKARSREADQRAVDSGEKSIAQVNAENSLWSGLSLRRVPRPRPLASKGKLELTPETCDKLADACIVFVNPPREYALARTALQSAADWLRRARG